MQREWKRIDGFRYHYGGADRCRDSIGRSYPSADAASAGGDLEVPVQVFNGAAGEEALHHQQDAVDEERRGDAVDHVLDDVNPGG